MKRLKLTDQSLPMCTCSYGACDSTPSDRQRRPWRVTYDPETNVAVTYHYESLVDPPLTIGELRAAVRR